MNLKSIFINRKFFNDEILVYIPVASSIIVLIIFLIIANILGLYKSTSTDLNILAQLGSVGRTHAHIILWGMSAFSVCALLIWNVFLSWHIIFSNTVNFCRFRLYILIGIVIISLIFSIAIFLGWKVAGTVTNTIQIRIETETGIPLRSLLFILNIIAFFTITSIIGASVALLLSPINGDNWDLEVLEKKLFQSRVAITSSGFLLTVAVFEIFAQYSWPVSFLFEPLASKVRLTAHIISLAAGILFTFLLLAIYVPMGFVQRNWIKKAYKSYKVRENNFKRKEWLDEYGISISTLDVFSKIIAVFSPILAAGIIHTFGWLWK